MVDDKMVDDKTQPAILFVCLGNICRSPLAEAAMRGAFASAGVAARVDSAGTGDWHVGRPPDARAIAAARAEGHDISGYRARQVVADDFAAFDHIVALDHSNLAHLRALAPAHARAELSLLLDHVPGRAGQDVADPYYEDAAAFAVTWADVSAGASGLLAMLAHQRSG